ncbi:MAG: Gfo/Idh/MocA family oxidoreductase [Chloroflexi bacterium]|nr:Gfo/Idh/MocA family oxidoreductase [Chloroflexota bacterium]OJV94070.1 MAG: oxidoreductase [Chloroflexi bacterium 54-19]
MLTSKTPVRVAILGGSNRSRKVYGPILKGLAQAGEVEVVAVWSRHENSAQELGQFLNLPWYTDLAKLVRETAPQVGVVSVNSGANGPVGLMAVENGLHVLVETPISHSLKEADAIIQAAAARNLKIEVAEQFHRRPLEQIKLKLLASGLFGQVYTAFNDFAGHGYHGVSVLRSYLGFDAVPVRVQGFVRDYPLAAHGSRFNAPVAPRDETQEHAMIEFADGRLGIYHWTNVGYDSALRWWRSSRFLAEKGMGLTVGVDLDVKEELTLLDASRKAPQFITLQRHWERLDGGPLRALVAFTGDSDQPEVRWDNPFYDLLRENGIQWHDDEIGVAGCIMSLVNAVRDGTEPTYGAAQGRVDQEIVVAMRESSRLGGQSVSLPVSVE